MISFTVRRIGLMIPTWFLVAIITFLLIHLTPGDPAAVLLGQDATVEGVEAVRHRLGLDRSLSAQLGDWVTGLLRGDIGDSYFLGRPVAAAIGERLPVTLSIATSALLIAVLIGIPLGVIASLRPGSLQDAFAMTIALLGVSVPQFLFGLLLMMLFAVTLGWLPVGGYVPIRDGFVPWLKHIIMPAFSLGIVQAALISRTTRSSMLEVLLQDYVQTARAKGLTEKCVVFRHAFRNASLPVLTTVGVIFALLLGGSFIVEVIFRIPGMGSLVIAAVKRRDYPIVQGTLITVSSMVLIINLLVDLAYGFLNPAVRYE
jgi:peptide/nickel transport system permease protein